MQQKNWAERQRESNSLMNIRWNNPLPAKGQTEGPSLTKIWQLENLDQSSALTTSHPLCEVRSFWNIAFQNNSVLFQMGFIHAVLILYTFQTQRSKTVTIIMGGQIVLPDDFLWLLSGDEITILLQLTVYFPTHDFRNIKDPSIYHGFHLLERLIGGHSYHEPQLSSACRKAQSEM